MALPAPTVQPAAQSPAQSPALAHSPICRYCESVPANRSLNPLWQRRARRISRRALLAASARAGVGAAGLALVGCGGDDDPQADLAAQQSAQELSQQQVETQIEIADQQEQQSEPQAEEQSVPQTPTGPIPGGIARFWLGLGQIDLWDPHRARNRQAQAVISLMYNRLVRPVAAGLDELEADLCSLPETPDEQTYVFTLQPLARFWNRPPTNGRPVLADDIRFNVERQQIALDADSNPDVRFLRQPGYALTASVEATDERTIRMTSNGPDVRFLQAHSGPWAWIISPEAAVANADIWAADPADINLSSGTGPYVPLAFDPAGELALGRSPNWWGPGDRAYPAGFIFSAPAEDSLVDAYYGGQIDWLGFPASNSDVRAIERAANENATEDAPLEQLDQVVVAPLDYGVQLLAPLDDPRIARAASLALDRGALAEQRWYDHGAVDGIVRSHLEDWALPREQLSEFPGYRFDRDADLADARDLFQAAGGADADEGLILAVGDLFEAEFPGSGEAVVAMLQEAGIHARVAYRPIADALRELSEGQKFLYLGYGRPFQRPDPTWEWLDAIHALGAENWSVPKPSPGGGDLDETLDQMRITLDLDARRQLALDVQQRLLSGDARQWIFPIASGWRVSIRKPYLNLHDQAGGIAWSSHRLAQSWLDQTAETYPADRALPPPPEFTDPPPEEAQPADSAE